MMNKRNTEGYVLAYVLIVVTVMGLIAATLITSTLQVIQAQENSIEYMKDKYAAMGEVEKHLAKLEFEIKEQSSSIPSNGIANLTASGFDDSNDAKDAAEQRLEDLVSIDTDNNEDFKDTEWTFDYTSSHGSATVSVGLKMFYDINISSYSTNSTDPTDPDAKTHYRYTITIKSLDYLSYEISSANLGGDT